MALVPGPALCAVLGVPFESQVGWRLQSRRRPWPGWGQIQIGREEGRCMSGGR